jgi:hypothetical protein
VRQDPSFDVGGGLRVDTLPDKPAGCVIADSVDASGVTLSLSSSTAPPALLRYFAVAFLVFFLCFWVYGELNAAAKFGSGTADTYLTIFLTFWLCGWVAGVWLASWDLWKALWVPRPESVRLEAEVLRYDPGGWWWPPSHTAEIPRSAFGGFVLGWDEEYHLGWVEKLQRLTFDLGAGEVEIGEDLCESDREWLFAVLQRWHGRCSPWGRPSAEL